ncbi:[citrate (pro-3S)-lyase] ligase [Erwinia sp. CPCC 100877]|nr:[citrate (pro-3S)-lyase] ligase [Erwinia sp. CPCC 100877]
MEIKRLWLERDQAAYDQWQSLLEVSDLTADDQVDYTVGIYQQDRLIATGSLYQNILKCIAIAARYQNENLLTQIVQQLRERLAEAGFTHYFLYTKPSVLQLFHALGFSEIIMTDELVFMEQGGPDFGAYLHELAALKRPTAKNAGIVMNANPFTNGHLFLITEAAKENETVYVFVVSEDRSLFDTATRVQLVKAGVRHLKNVVVLPTREYIVSSATFPSYFLKDQAKETVAKVQAKLDAKLFKERIAPALGITTRYVGEEPLSPVTNLYNQAMANVFSAALKLVVVPRKQQRHEVISASRVRALMKEQDYEAIRPLVPETTLNEILKQIKK